jgi:histidinol-phosphate aminotransferase
MGANMMLGNGSDELIHLVIQACARPDATVVSPWPSFSMYELSARFDGCRFVGVPLNADFTMATNALLAAIAEHRPAVVFIAYPNNPTGNLFDRSGLEAVLRAAPGLVVIDEAYLPFAQDTWMPQLRNWPNLLVLRTLSKLGLAGIRLGYLAGDPEWIAQLEKLRPPYNVTVLTLAAADLLLEHLRMLEQQALMVRTERSRVANALSGLRGVQVFPSAANFLLFRVGDPDAVFNGLKQRAILIKNVSRMHPLLAGCLRTTIGTSVENDSFVQALRATLEGGK